MSVGNPAQPLPPISVWALVVSYEPDMERLRQNLYRLRSQCPVLVVDNSPRPESQQAVSQLCRQLDCRLHTVGRNIGLGAANNLGAAQCLAAGADFVLFMDQDTLAPENLVTALLTAHSDLERMGARVGVLGPMPCRADGYPYVLQGHKQPHGAYVRTGAVINSGALITRSLLAAHRFDEGLFVDMVDTEYCWRLGQAGYGMYIVPTVRIEHRVGLRDISVFGRRIAAVSVPLRNYYQTRNLVYLALRGRVPTRSVVLMLLRRLFAICMHAMLSGQPLQRLRYSSLGLCHGVMGRMGPYPGIHRH